MTGLELTTKRTLQIWWALAWRSFLASMLLAFIVGSFFGVLVAVFHAQVPPKILKALTSFSILILGLPIGIWIFQTVMTKSFSDFRIVIMPVEELAQQGGPADAGTTGPRR